MLRHFLEVKAQHPDAVVFYRMGDFFELFFEDAVAAAPILEVTLTARHKGTENEVPMCGVPHHAAEAYLGKLLRAGKKVAICDQVEDPSQAKGLVRREVTRVVTPGTVSQPELLESKEANLLACAVWRGNAEEGRGAGAFLDVSTGAFFVRRWESLEEAVEDLALQRPREILLEADAPGALRAWVDREGACRTEMGDDRLLDRARAHELLAAHLETSTLRGFGLEDGEPGVLAAAAALAYARETQQNDLSHVTGIRVGRARDGMVLDSTTLRNLEIFRSLREGGRRGSLLGVLDRTVTAHGGRLLREWLGRPLLDATGIERRHDVVGELLADGPRREEIRDRLARLGDLERLASRAVLGSLSPREAAALRSSLETVPELLDLLATSSAELLREIADSDPLPELAARLRAILAEDPPATMKNGGVIADGVSEELDRVRSMARDSKKHILKMESREREETGISSLKIRYNKVFGYFLEVTKANQALVPDRYIRKQTLVNAERYVTPEIKELEEQILGAEERQLALEEDLWAALKAEVAAESGPMRELSRALATLDVLATFADLAARRSYCRPRILGRGAVLRIEEGRHPVVEITQSDDFVPNGVEIGDEARIILLTGPNMGGKSTFLRQVALLVVLAQIGSFVPAKAAEIGLVDRVFTRVGASDDLSRGESTFMVEMIETANILHQATADSLVVLDEVGRGTATFDGLSLAWAIVEHLHATTRAKTLFATHYHELTELASLLPEVVNRTLAVKEWEDRILFLRRVVAGSADKSYGIHVARLAGIPDSVTRRADEILANLEAQEYDLTGQPRLARSEEERATGSQGQMALFAPREEVVAAVLRDVDLDEMTPLAALNLLHTLKARLAGGETEH